MFNNIEIGSKTSNFTFSKLNVVDVVVPPGISVCNVYDYVRNPNLNILVIECMCLGIILNDHIANKFQYIQNINKYDEDEIERVTPDGMKIYTINKEWDTRKWSYTKISKFYKYIHEIENMSCSQIEEHLKKRDYKNNEYVDYHFLESLCWNNDIENI